MRDITDDPKYKASNCIPFAFAEGDLVTKTEGDYTFNGVVLACFRKRSGTPRYAVENEEGLVHIFNHNQLKRASL